MNPERRRAGRAGTGARWAHVACCVARDGRADEILEAARQVADDVGARLTVVHGAPRPVLEEPAGRGGVARPGDPSRVASEWLAEIAGAYGADAALIVGTVPAAVCAWAVRAGPDVLVVGATRGPVTRALAGGFASHLAYHASCDVLVVRAPAAEEDQR